MRGTLSCKVTYDVGREMGKATAAIQITGFKGKHTMFGWGNQSKLHGKDSI